MNYFDEASKINQSISAIDKKICILYIELQNTETEREKYSFYFDMTMWAKMCSSNGTKRFCHIFLLVIATT